MAKEITVTKAVRNFSDLIGRIKYRDESFILTKGGVPVAKVIPADKRIRAREVADLLKGIKHLSSEEAEELFKDLVDSKSILKEIVDKWES